MSENDIVVNPCRDAPASSMRTVLDDNGEAVLLGAVLRRVLDADVTRWPERRLANEPARPKARRYLGAVHKPLP